MKKPGGATHPASAAPDAARRALALLGGKPARVAVAPGRVNLLGGHTDYSEGYVLPAAVDRFVACAFLPSSSSSSAASSSSSASSAGSPSSPDAAGPLTFVSEAFDDRFELDPSLLQACLDDRRIFEQLTSGGERGWRRYVTGVALELFADGHPLPAGTAAVAGDVPIGSGLSSSAALELAVHLALAPQLQPSAEVALRCQRAENRWAGMPCGIMDQLASALGRADHALLIDCRDLSCRPVPLPSGARITVVDSGISRDLAGGSYANRRNEIETAVEILRKALGPIRSLRDVSSAEFEEVEDLLPQPLRNRALHVVAAIERARAGAAHLALGEVDDFGRLMKACHDSLAALYEVSIPELDLIVERAMATDGVFGARLTGAGFGGCCVVLHEEGAEETLAAGIRSAFGGHGAGESVGQGVGQGAGQSAGQGAGSGADRLVFHHLRAADGGRLLDSTEIAS